MKTENAPAQPAAANDEQAVLAAIRTFETGWNRHDMDVMFQAFTADAEWVNVVGMWWRGLADVTRGHRAYHDTMFANTPFTIDEIRVRLVTSDAAVAVVRWNKGAFTPPDGRLRPASRDMMSVFLVKQAGRWLIAAGHNTTIDEAALPFDPIK
jgi:uncharacterized protein (TIGR02246 family)